MIQLSKYSYGQIGQKIVGTHLAIGHFDGCHQGHIELIKSLPHPPAVASFYPRPSTVLSSQASNQYLFTREQKPRAFKELQIQRFFEIEFDSELAATHAVDFAKQLIDVTNPISIWSGKDFRFGKGRAGDLKLFNDISPAIEIHTVKLFLDEDGKKLGSGSIRSLIADDGLIVKANSQLGRSYLYESYTIPGLRLGRTIGFPTLNVFLNVDQIVPKPGVYAGYISLESHPSIFKNDFKNDFKNEKLLPAAINIGINPTVSNQSKLKMEAHILNNFSAEDYYDKPIGLYFERRIRDERKFDSLDLLKEQLVRDTEMAKNILA